MMVVVTMSWYRFSHDKYVASKVRKDEKDTKYKYIYLWLFNNKSPFSSYVENTKWDHVSVCIHGYWTSF